MRTIGLLGGMSWESTLLYYRLINEAVRDRLGGLRSASLVLESFDFEPIKQLQYAGRWDEAGARLGEAARRLEVAGAEAIVICTNTMHKVAAQVQAATGAPLLHIADCTAGPILDAGLRRIALLGTRFTMEEDFYKQRLAARGIEVVTPDSEGVEAVNRVIYDELCQGRVLPASRERYQAVIDGLRRRGAEGVILGCTEITLLIGQEDVELPVFDTTALHARAAADFCMGDEAGVGELAA